MRPVAGVTKVAWVEVANRAAISKSFIVLGFESSRLGVGANGAWLFFVFEMKIVRTRCASEIWWFDATVDLLLLTPVMTK